MAGGYSLDIMNSMRHAVAVSRMREGSRKMALDDGDQKSKPNTTVSNTSLAIDWKEALYLATQGGVQALGLPSGFGRFAVGSAFDAQKSRITNPLIRIDYSSCLFTVKLFDPATGTGNGALDFFDIEVSNIASRAAHINLTEQMIEKWWSLGDGRHREAVWVQGARLL